MNVRHGFQQELTEKYSQDIFLFEFIGEVFKWMPVAHLINQKIFVIHGMHPICSTYNFVNIFLIGGLPDCPTLTLDDIRAKR